jgi:hypothetical protein
MVREQAQAILETSTKTIEDSAARCQLLSAKPSETRCFRAELYVPPENSNAMARVTQSLARPHLVPGETLWGESRTKSTEHFRTGTGILRMGQESRRAVEPADPLPNLAKLIQS